MVTETMERRPVPAFVVAAEQSDAELRAAVLEAFERAEKQADARNWLLGKLATAWKSRDASRTDAGFAEFCGGPVTADAVKNARRVWEEFGESVGELIPPELPAGITWTHHLVSLGLRAVGESPSVGIDWAVENPRTVTENGEQKLVAESVSGLRTWIRIQAVGRGVELVEVEDGGSDSGSGTQSADRAVAPDWESAETRGVDRAAEEPAAVERVAGRDPADEKPYAPFRSDAGKPARNHDVDRTKLAPERGAVSKRQKQAKAWLEQLSRIFNAAQKAGCGDLVRDHASELCDQQTHGQKLVGLDKATRDALLRDL